MTISIWRYSHLTLAISSSVFILLAALTGIILAFEPILDQQKPYAIKNANTLSLSKTIENLKGEYDEVIHVEIDKNDFVIASVFTKEGKNETFYINPFTAEKIGDIIEKEPIFKFATNIHRSLFLKSTGRAIVGFVSFLLFLMAVTGLLLIIKRQGGIKRYFSKIIKEDFEQYYHIIIGRYTLIPLIIVTLSGVYLSLEKFSLLPSDKNVHILYEEALAKTSKLTIADFDLLKSITLNDIERVEFPFSDDVEDYFVLKLKDKEWYVNQYNGKIVSEKKDSLVALVSSWSMALHTGQGSTLWSIVLLFTCIAILFFTYSGFAMTLKRRNKSIKIKNKFSKDTAEYVILVGSETGSTFGFAKALYKALIAQGKSVFVSELNNYSSYRKAAHLVVFTSTYGDGEAPTNAKYFQKLMSHVSQQNTLQYSVVGFGSLAYKGFCKYAIVVDSLLQAHQKFIPNLLLHKINNQSFNAFKNWTELWSKSKGLSLKIEKPVKMGHSKKAKRFKVVYRSEINLDHSFLIELEPMQKEKFTSGDLLSVYPENDAIERLYSIGKINNNMLLSIKKHEFGICSNYFSELKENDIILADIKQNKGFHLPASAKEVIMVANGTGIAPFLGMINDKNHNQTKNYLFWGGRTKDSYQMYSEQIDKAFYNKTLSGLFLSFSKEESERKYVQNTLVEKEKLISRVLKNGGIIMICGSIAMQNGVLETLENISISRLDIPLNMNQIKTDCY
ncbi:PepSY domain-containing protein [Flavivirga spongiicola]|uniref:Methionine synthase reductase n=1 Tax=Flavivirga spongiicola TaxID=421621 RepID=A0ABU7XTH5_9FLAO|nr:PepSY domain-containing protein [Flavivirga sp. MEBiC05379]MDO5979074.1 PepSY domain-containing protein [Flavivirga sp. MEBiC05379]